MQKSTSKTKKKKKKKNVTETDIRLAASEMLVVIKIRKLLHDVKWVGLKLFYESCSSKILLQQKRLLQNNKITLPYIQ